MPLTGLATRAQEAVVQGSPGRPLPLRMDTLAAAKMLRDGGWSIPQTEALVEVTQALLKYRLEQSAREYLVDRGRVVHDLAQSLATHQDLQSALAAQETQQQLVLRALHLRHQDELSATLESLKDRIATLKTDVTMAVNGFQADGREEGLKMEMVVHRHDGALTIALGGFRTSGEHVKLKAVFSFSAMLISMFSIIILQRMLSG